MEIKVSKYRMRQLPPTNNKVVGAARIPQLTRRDAAKVKVQYIRNHQIVEKASLDLVQNFIASEEVLDNVEYLEDEYRHPEDVIGASNDAKAEDEAVAAMSNNDFVDTFYRNAIHCLIALYREQYQKMQGKSANQIRAARVWEHIATAMNESFFNFSAAQVKQKYQQLRRLYFSASSAVEIDELEYFDELHEIYQDRIIDDIAANGEARSRTVTQCGEALKVYADEALQQEDEATDGTEEQQIAEPLLIYPSTQEIVDVDTDVQQNKIAHKEHEFIDMVEKELQAMEASHDALADVMQSTQHDEMILLERQAEVSQLDHDGSTANERQKHQTSPTSRKERTLQSIPNKRLKIEAPTLQRIKTTSHTVKILPENYVEPVANNVAELPLTPVFGAACQTDRSRDMSLADYNVAQEHRHREKIELMRRHVQLQERTIEIQCMLMEQLIKHAQ